LSTLDTALAYIDAGLCVLPAHRDEKRPDLSGWKSFQSRLPTEIQVRSWFAEPRPLCVLTGRVSGNLEMIDFDHEGELFDRWQTLVESESPGLTERLVIESSQSGGWHVVYRCGDVIPGNRKLAQRTLAAASQEPVEIGGKSFVPRRIGDRFEITLTLIETRGEGGLFLCCPTPGYEIVQGSFTDVPVLSSAERAILIEAALTLNEVMPIEPLQHGESITGDRPGDDFNERGDVRELLRRHGWSLARNGENEYWRRPGKDRGWSATLHDRSFYVFSSNAAPFDAERSYRPFSVYTHLEHNGDFKAAAIALRALGYGSILDTIDVDLSGIFAQSEVDEPEPASESIDPGPIPDSLFQVPGFVDDVMAFTLASAPYPNRALAFCGALALQSFLSGRKVCTSGDLRTNIYLLALASSGTGKEFPRKVNSQVLYQVGLANALGDKFASGEGIQDALIRTPAMLFQNDEMDGVLRQINLDQENRRESIPNILLTLYTSASDVYPTRVKAGQKEVTIVDQPHLTLFGTATPQYFYESLSQRMLTNGFFARLSIVDVGKRGAGQTPGSPRDLPNSILDVARWWAEYQPGSGNLQGFHPEPRRVAFTPDAEAAVNQLRLMTEAEYDRAEAARDEVGRTAWSRTCEHAKKLALIYACSENHEAPVINLAAIQWATEFAMHQTRRQLHLAATYVAENPFHAECLKLMRKLRDAPQQQMQRQQLLRLMRCKATDFDQIIGTLIQQGEIATVSIGTRTKPAQGYQAL
jgi:hypothetical protein